MLKIRFETPIKLLLLSLFSCFQSAVIAQSNSGIMGKKWLLGYEANWKYIQGNSESTKPIASRLLHKFIVERQTEGRSNIGISITSGKAISSFDHYNYNNNLPYEMIEYYKNDTLNHIDYIDGLHQLNTTGIEFNIKRYWNANNIRNYGWYFNYRFGIILMKSQLLHPTKLTVHDATKDGYYSNYKYYNETFNESYKSNAKFIGIDLGKTYPFHSSRILFNYSFSWNITFNKTKHDQSLESNMNYITGRNVARRHMLTFNMGFAYVL